MGARVFISHSDEDVARCDQLVKVLGEWGVPCHFDGAERSSDRALSADAQQAIVECDIMLRVCSQFTNRSYWMSIEAGAYLALQAEDHRSNTDGRHKIINLLLDKTYTPEPFDINSTVIDATYSLSAVWVNDLRRALDLPPVMDIAPIAERINPPQEQRLSRRAVVGLGAAGALVAAGVAAGGYELWLRNQPVKQQPPSSDTRLKWWRPAGNIATRAKGDELINVAPIVSGGAIYIATTQGLLLALTLDGGTLWRYTFPTASGIYSNPAVSADVVFAAVYGAGLYAIQNGAQVWADNSAGVDILKLTRISVTDGKLYVSSITELAAFITVIDTSNGAVLSDLGPKLYSIPTTAPVVVGDVVYVASNDGQIYAMDRRQTKAGQLWAAKVGAGMGAGDTWVNANLVVDSGVVYAASLNTNVYALDAKTGAQRWVYSGSDAFRILTPTLANGVLYAVSQDGVLHALDSATGSLRWKNKTAVATSEAVVDNGVVYVGTETKGVVALDAATGKQRTAFQTTDVILGRPSVANSTLYAADSSGYVYAFRLN